MRIVVLVSRNPDWALDLAAAWAGAGNDVTAVLCDHAASRARLHHPAAGRLTAAADAGVVLRAHDEALAARGVPADALAAFCKPVDLDEIADLLAHTAAKAVWL